MNQPPEADWTVPEPLLSLQSLHIPYSVSATARSYQRAAGDSHELILLADAMPGLHQTVRVPLDVSGWSAMR